MKTQMPNQIAALAGFAGTGHIEVRAMSAQQLLAGSGMTNMLQGRTIHIRLFSAGSDPGDASESD